VHPEKCTHKIVIIKIKGYGTSLPGFNPIVRSRTVAGFNAPPSHLRSINESTRKGKEEPSRSPAHHRPISVQPQGLPCSSLRAGRNIEINLIEFMVTLFSSRCFFSRVEFCERQSSFLGDLTSPAIMAQQQSVQSNGRCVRLVLISLMASP
jgi:hypothetical protein